MSLIARTFDRLMNKAHRLIGAPVVAVAVMHDAGGGALARTAVAGATFAEVELAALALLRNAENQMGADFHDCADCRARMDRLQRAIAALGEAFPGATHFRDRDLH